MNEFGKLIDANTLQFVRLLPASADKIWEYLVDDHKRSLWFAGGPADLTPNGTMKLIFNNSGLSAAVDPIPEKYKEFGNGFTSLATILEIDPPNLLVLDWENGIIQFELDAISGSSTRLTLTHERLHKDKDQRIGASAGWHTHLNILEDRIRNNEIPGFWSVHMKLEEEYDKLL